MKRFLIALFICLVPFGARAITPIISVTDPVGVIQSPVSEKQETSSVNFSTWDLTKSIVLGGVGNISDFNYWFQSDDKLFRLYADEDDYNYMMEHGSHFYMPAGGTEGNANYQAFSDSIRVDISYFNSSPRAQVQDTIHHEVQHLKDNIMFREETGLDTFLFDYKLSPYLDTITRELWHAVLEARAYSEQVYFLYTKMKNFERILEKKYGSIDKAKGEASRDKDGYEEIWIEYNDFMNAYVKESKDTVGYPFDEAIKAGKSPEEARRIAAIAALNWQFVDDGGYMKNFAEGERGNKHINVNEIINVLNKDGENRFTLQDLYAADRFWIHLCSYDSMKDTEECQAAQRRWQYKNCENRSSRCGNLTSFLSKFKIKANLSSKNSKSGELLEKIDGMIEKDKMCGRGKRLLTNDFVNDKPFYKHCCTLDWDFSSNYIPKNLNIYEWTKEMLGKN